MFPRCRAPVGEGANRVNGKCSGLFGTNQSRLYNPGQHMERLSETEIAKRLADLPEWVEISDAIQRTLGFKDFTQAMKFVNAVAEAAEKAQHHPDILIRYNKVTLTLSTHDASGVTEKDFAFAATVDRLAAPSAKP